MYEHLYLPRLRKIDAVLRSLELPFTIPGHEGSVTLGHLARRLDITLPSDSRGEWQESGESVLMLLERTPNTLSVRLDWQALKGVLDPTTLEGGGRFDKVLLSLESLDISETFRVPVLSFASRFLAFMDHHPRLKRLDLVTIRIMNDITCDSQTSTARPAIREIDFSPSELIRTRAIFPPGVFPNLEKAVVLCHAPTIDAFADCLRAHGKPLKAVLLAYSFMMDDTHTTPAVPTWHDVQAVLGVLGESCPALEELAFCGTDVVAIPSQPTNGRSPNTILTVTTLGIEIKAHKRQFSKRTCNEFLDSALSWTRRSHLPNLRRVMFLSESNVRYMRRSHPKRLDKFIQDCAAAGVQVEDSFRTPLHTCPRTD